MKFTSILETRKEDKAESKKNIEEMNLKIQKIKTFLSGSGAKIENILKKSSGVHGEQKVSIFFSHPLNDKEHELILTNIQGYSGLNSWILIRESKNVATPTQTPRQTTYVNPTKDTRVSFEEKISGLIPKRFDV